MLRRVLIYSILVLAQAGCSVEEGVGSYRITSMTDETRQGLERQKRELLKIEDIRIGDGPLAAWGRQLKANIEVRYIGGMIAFQGSMWVNIGFDGDVFILNANNRAGALDYGQPGVWLGLNGMAVGGKRRITIAPELISGGTFIQGVPGYPGADVRKETLIVEATLTASCIPTLLRAIHLPTSRYMIEREIGCRDHGEPRRNSSDPIWKFY